MSLNPKPKSRPQTPKWLPSAQKIIIKAYLRGLVSSKKTGEWFSVQDDFGGSKADWSVWHPDLLLFYQHYINAGKNDEDAQNEAAIKLGHMLKLVLVDSRMQYEWRKNGRGNNEYCLI